MSSTLHACMHGGHSFAVVQVCVVSRGSKACLVRSCNGEHFTCNPPEVAVVDTVGAGDCFAAGFLHAYLRGSSLQVEAATLPAPSCSACVLLLCCHPEVCMPVFCMLCLLA